MSVLTLTVSLITDGFCTREETYFSLDYANVGVLYQYTSSYKKYVFVR
jgi:hypothetical protein